MQSLEVGETLRKRKIEEENEHELLMFQVRTRVGLCVDLFLTIEQNAARNRSVAKPEEDLSNVIKFHPPASTTTAASASSSSSASAVDKGKLKPLTTVQPKVVIKPVKREKVEPAAGTKGTPAAKEGAQPKPLLPSLASYESDDDD